MIQRTYGRISYLSWEGFEEIADYLVENKTNRTIRYFEEEADDSSWHGTDGYSWPEVLGLARQGMDASQVARMDRLRQEATLSGDHGTVWVQSHDVSGAYVDIDRYLVGEPECMISFDETIDRTAGSVVTLAAPISAHCGIDEKAIEKRGEQIVKAILSVDSFGLQTEVYATLWLRESWGDEDGKLAFTKILVKAAGETLSPERVMFAFMPMAMRALSLPAMQAHDKSFHSPLGFSPMGGHGGPMKTYGREMDDLFLPENTVYIPGMEDDRDANLDITKMVFNALGLSQTAD